MLTVFSLKVFFVRLPGIESFSFYSNRIVKTCAVLQAIIIKGLIEFVFSSLRLIFIRESESIICM